MAIRRRHWIVTLPLLCALLLPARAGAAADLTAFLVPGTRAPVVVADWPFELRGLRTDGSLDPRFGREGIARAPFSGAEDLRADDAVTLADGRIVLSGAAAKLTPDGRNPRHVALACFDASGWPDRGFGDGGTVLIHRGGRGSEVAAPRGGGLLIGGSAGRFPLLLRLRADGRPDRRFGRRGALVLRLHGGPDYTGPFEGRVTDLVPRPEGGAVVVVYGSFGARDDVSFILRVGARGRIDRGFGHGGRIALDRGFGVGKAALDLPGIERRVHGLRAQGGRLLALAETGASQIALVALRPDGRLDRDYGRDGVAVGPWTPSGVSQVAFALERDGGAMFAMPGVGTQFPTFVMAWLDPEDEGKRVGGETTPYAVPGRGPYSVVVRPGGHVLALSFDPDLPHEPWVARFEFRDNGRQTIWPGPGQIGPH